jgi:hypothetical protein
MLMGMDGDRCAFHYNKNALVLYQKGRTYMDLNELLGPIENATPEHLRKAVLWGPESLFMDSVEIFLKAGRAWDVVKISNECSVDYLIQHVRSLKPAVVILCQNKNANDVSLLIRLAQIEFCLKVVVLSLESNLMQVYGRRDVMMRDISDLLSVVDTEYSPNKQPNEEVQGTE